MADLRITKIVCPSCGGSGKFSTVIDIPCMWCRGEKRLATEKAHDYADNLFMLAGGGFIAGDHDFEHKVEMEKRAEKIYALTGCAPPWSSRRLVHGTIADLGGIAEKSLKVGDNG